MSKLTLNNRLISVWLLVDFGHILLRLPYFKSTTLIRSDHSASKFFRSLTGQEKTCSIIQGSIYGHLTAVGISCTSYFLQMNSSVRPKANGSNAKLFMCYIILQWYEHQSTLSFSIFPFWNMITILQQSLKIAEIHIQCFTSSLIDQLQITFTMDWPSQMFQSQILRSFVPRCFEFCRQNYRSELKLDLLFYFSHLFSFTERTFLLLQVRLSIKISLISFMSYVFKSSVFIH